ncbi:D-amino-acid transaminase [Metabacillus indicus]|uniref:D-amino-acid transaminase n=1 Tax=Metabacillus indicus TaxID=246786 RepID=UPI00317F054A
MYILVNGEYKKRDEVTIDLEDRGHQFGDGVYEVIRVYDGAFFAMKEHMERFIRSAEEIKIDLPYTIGELTGQLEELLRLNKTEDGGIYMQVTRGAAARKHLFPGKDTLPELTAYPIPCSKPASEQEVGISLSLLEDVRWLRCDIKSLNLLGNVLAKQEAHDRGAYEALLHRSGMITEGSSSNFYGVKNGSVFTHPANNLILNGVTRMKVEELCRQNGIEFLEERLSTEGLVSLDEAFITSTTSEVIPVIKVDEGKIGEGIPGPVTRKLQKLFDELIAKETNVVEK